YAALRGNLGEHFRVADVPALLEVRAEQRIDDCRLVSGKSNQSVSLRGIRLDRHAIERELDALALALFGHARVHLLRALERAELGLAVVGARDAAGRQVGVLLQAPLADVAPGADHVGGDFETELLHAAFSTSSLAEWSRSRPCARS